MIDKKKIEKELLCQVKSRSWNTIEEQHSYKDGFGNAVEWAQKEFVSSLWHDAREKPKKHKCVFVEMQNDSSYLYVIDRNHGNWKMNVKTCGYIRWCYLDDILPKKGGENG